MTNIDRAALIAKIYDSLQPGESMLTSLCDAACVRIQRHHGDSQMGYVDPNCPKHRGFASRVTADAPLACPECGGRGEIEDDATGALGYAVKKACPRGCRVSSEATSFEQRFALARSPFFDAVLTFSRLHNGESGLGEYGAAWETLVREAKALPREVSTDVTAAERDIDKLAKAVLFASAALDIDMGDGEETFQCCNSVCSHGLNCLIGIALPAAMRITTLTEADLVSNNRYRVYGAMKLIAPTEHTREDGEERERLAATDAYGLPNDLQAAKEEISEWRQAVQALGIMGGPDALRKRAVELLAHHDEHHAHDREVAELLTNYHGELLMRGFGHDVTQASSFARLVARIDAVLEALDNAACLRDASEDVPLVDDFFPAVREEMDHQVRRWGRTHDKEKAPEDWFWLLGYLGGKALAAVRARDREKALHHCISSAAVLGHWHEAIKGATATLKVEHEPSKERA